MEKNTEKKKNKGLIIGLIIGGAVLLILAIIFFLLFILKPKYKVVVNNGGGTITRDIVMKDNKIETLPEVTPPQGKVFVVWVNQDKEAVRPDIDLPGNTTLDPVFEDENRETVTLKFVTETDEIINDITITKGTEVILPVKPKAYKDWKFLYWVDKDGFIVLKEKRIYEDTTIYAYWFKPATNGEKQEEVTIKFKTGTKENVDSIKLIKGSKYLFPTLKEKNGDKVFKGWLDPDGKLLTIEDVVEKDITLTAKWMEPYTCPENCTPSEDGKTCTRKLIQEMNHSAECVDPYEVINGHCVDTFDKFSAYYQHDGTCPSGYYQWDDCFAGGCDVSCAREVGFESGSWCPEGYTEENGQCAKIETVECTAN